MSDGFYICGGSDFHPYECSHDKYCEHCTQATTDWHDPKKCAFCIGDGEAWVKEPFAIQIRPKDYSHRKLKVLVKTFKDMPQQELPF